MQGIVREAASFVGSSVSQTKVGRRQTSATAEESCLHPTSRSPLYKPFIHVYNSDRIHMTKRLLSTDTLLPIS